VKLNRLSVTMGSILLAGAPLAQAKDPMIAKQLAGAPAEFAQMRAPDPAAAAIHSKSALVPVQLAADRSGSLSWSGTLPVEGGTSRFLVFTGSDASWQVQLADPQGVSHDARALAREARRAQFGMERISHPVDLYALENVASGPWTLNLQAPAGSARHGFVLIEGHPGTELASYQTHTRQLVGEQIGVTAMLTATDAADAIALGRHAGRIESASLRVTLPDGSIRHYPMFDDGRHDDGTAGDGLFAGSFPAERAGNYLAQVVVHGNNRVGEPIIRTAEHVIPVVTRSITLLSHRANANATGQGRLAIELPVAASKSTQHYRAYAEVWGRDARGRDLPVAWIGGMVDAGAGTLSLGFDERWVTLSGARAPFELRNLRVEDPDHFVTVAQADRLSLSLPPITSKLAARDIVIDEAMTMGLRPVADVSQRSTGSRLLLVHGYCSGGVWPTAQFSNASTFLDANQNRSHDQFARLLRTYGSNWNSFGVVAHSQGGAAALHLYTYYWSGLDKATGNRLIQSVGTPYQGTNLAGILAALGSWFGVGCGTNDNLSYSGASAWMAGIPTWARSKVNYYTTSFATAWWRWDYCNAATDLVLSDPEDGTTERVNGQLSGALNRGHTTGQCHTAGMRDPAQYLDAGRNSIMNSNAAR
jgi:hypothetical protein